MPRVFLSYSHEDHPLALQLAHDLTLRGCDVWMDREAIAVGAKWRDAIVNAIAGADSAVLLVSEAARHSDGARYEWSLALASAQRVIPVLVPGFAYGDLPLELAHIQAVSLSNYEGAVSAIVEALRSVPSHRKPVRDRRLDYLDRPVAEVHTAVAAAEGRLDLATDAFDGWLTGIPALFDALDSAVRVRVVLPDPEYLRGPLSGRRLEEASLTRASLEQLRGLDRRVEVRLVAQNVQRLLRVDSILFLDPLPSSSRTHGALKLRRGKMRGDLFEAAAETFEELYETGSPYAMLPPRLPDDIADQVERLLASENPRDFEYAAQLVFSHMGLEATASAQYGDPGYDLVVWDPHAGPAVVQVKRGTRPQPAAAIHRLARAAEVTGTATAYLFTESRLTEQAQAAVRLLADRGIDVRVVTVADALFALRKRDGVAFADRVATWPTDKAERVDDH